MNEVWLNAFKKGNIEIPKEEVKEMPKKYENKDNKSQHNKKEEYANAPYNFIEFPDRVVYRYDNIDDLPKHDVFRSDLNTGYIEYKIKNINPLFIGGGENDDFFKVGGKFVVPGSTMRGRVRSNAEVLSFSYPQFVEDRRFLYRGLADKSNLKKEYDKKLKEVVTDSNLKRMEEGGIDKKVKAGYIFKYKNSYYIVEAMKVNDKSFHKVDEFDLKRENLTSHINQLYNLKPEDLLILNLKGKDEAINSVRIEIKEIYKKMKEEFDEEKDLKEVGKLIKSISDKYSLFVKNITKSNISTLKISIENIFLGKDKKPEIEYNILSKAKKFQKDILDKYEEKAKLRIEKEGILKKVKRNRDCKLNKIYKNEISTSLLNNLSIRNKLEEEKIEKVVLYNSNDIYGKRSHYLINDISDLVENKYIVIDLIISEYNSELKTKTFITSLNKEVENELKKINSDKTFEALKKEKIKEINDEIRREYALPENECVEISKKEIKEKGKIIFFKPFYELKKDKKNKTVAKELFEAKSISRTPYLRLSYDCTTNEILNKKMKYFENNQEKNILKIYDKDNKNLKNIVDYSEAIFGFTNKVLKVKKDNKEIECKTISYKGRVNFTDLEFIIGKGQKGKEKMVLTNPKATSFQLYLKQDEKDNKNLKTYNNSKAELRGNKFYWQQDIKESQNKDNENMGKEINPLYDNCEFKGKIYFENLKDDELGLLLLSLKYDDSTTDNIGMAKPYGYGKIEMEDIELVIEKKKESFKDFFFKENNDSDKSIEEYKKDFKNKFLEIYGNGKEVDTSEYEKIKIIDQYKISKKNYKGKEELRYMGIKEFSDRKPLKDINDYVKESKK